MDINDKHNVLSSIADNMHQCIPSFLAIELGCGLKKNSKYSIGIDALDYPSVDIVGDVYDVISAFPACSVDHVYSSHFVEHIQDVPKLLTELSRIVKPNGLVEFVAPHFSNPYFYSDPTHKSFFGLYTFLYLANGSPFARQVPMYGYKPGFKIVKVDLIFKSNRPFIVRYGIKRLLGAFFNSCNYLKELYEENLCYIFPCYEVRYIIQREGL